MISASTIIPRRVLAAGALLVLLALFSPIESAAQPVPSGTKYTVTTLVDELDATLAPGTGAGTSLREAVAYSAAGDSVVFAPGLTGTIFLSLGEITFFHDLILVGPGLDVLEVNGNDLNRIFTVDTSVALDMTGLTLAAGRAVDGAAIRSFGWLAVRSSALRWSTAIQRGGAIYHEGSTLLLGGSRFEYCEAYMHGGAVAVVTGALQIAASSFSNNMSGGNGGAVYLAASGSSTGAGSTFFENTAAGAGGAIAIGAAGVLSLTRVTLHDNRAQNGGAISNAGILSMVNSTVSGNTAHNFGGGIRSTNAATLDFTTIAYNSASEGGGAHAGGTFATKRSLYAENSASAGPNVRGSVSTGGTNLVSIGAGSAGWNGSDLVGTVSDPVTAALDELRLNGGSTKTHALLVCSRAIDAADSAGTGIMQDQRGMMRRMNGDHDAVARPDIGAYEVPSPLDNTPPTVNGHPAFTVYLDASGSATITKDTVLLSAYDNCGIRSSSVNKLSFTCADTGDVVLTLTATDLSYNVTTKQVTVRVVDDTPPTLTIPADLTVSASSSSCGVNLTNAQLGTYTATDGCGGVTVTNNSPGFFPVGSTLVIWTATDASGNETTKIQQVTVNDNTNPTITAPAALSLNTLPGQCAIPLQQVTLGNPTVSDNCSWNVSNDAPSSFPLGTTVVTWTATDASGNSSTAAQNVTVTDVVPPIIFAPADLSLVADTGSCSRDGATVSLGAPTFSDNCSNVTVVNDKPGTFPIGETIVTWTATDSTGNVATAQQRVTVFDANPPSVVAPPDIEVEVDPGTCAWTVDPNVLGSATSYDNCSVPNVTNSAGSSLKAGTHRVIWTAFDANSNRSTDVQIVTVVGEPPTISCPLNITQNTDPGMPGAVVTWSPPTANSSCSEIEIIRTGGLGSGDFFPVGTTTVSYMAIDASNQIATCSFDVTVVDNEAPQITVSMAPEYLWPANNQWVEVQATVEVWDNVPGATAVLTSITGNQNISGDVQGATTNVFDLFWELRAKNVQGARVYTILYTATDVAGNTASASATVTVPTQKPKDFEEEDLPVPTAVTLEQNYPNPFNPSTLITFGTPQEQHIELRVYNAMGQPVRTLVSTVLGAGQYTVEWDGRDDAGSPLPSGVYLSILRTGSSHAERKMILAR